MLSSRNRMLHMVASACFDAMSPYLDGDARAALKACIDFFGDDTNHYCGFGDTDINEILEESHDMSKLWIANNVGHGWREKVLTDMLRNVDFQSIKEQLELSVDSNMRLKWKASNLKPVAHVRYSEASNNPVGMWLIMDDWEQEQFPDKSEFLKVIDDMNGEVGPIKLYAVADFHQFGYWDGMIPLVLASDMRSQ